MTMSIEKRFVIFGARHLVVGKVRGRFDSFEGDFTIVEDAEQLSGRRR